MYAPREGCEARACVPRCACLLALPLLSPRVSAPLPALARLGRQRGFLAGCGKRLGVGTTLKAMRTVVSQKKRRFREGGFDLGEGGGRSEWRGGTSASCRSPPPPLRRPHLHHASGDATPPLEQASQRPLTLPSPAQLIAMGFPSSGSEGLYRNPMPEVQVRAAPLPLPLHH